MAPKKNKKNKKLLNSPMTKKAKNVLEESDDEIVRRDQNQQKEQDEYISTEEKSEEEKDETEEEDDNVPGEPTKKRAKPIPLAPAVNSGSKLPAESESKESKKKKSANISGDEEKRGRVWSDDDEITILNGLIEFESENGTLTKAKIGAFHDLIKDNLETDADDTKLLDKVRRLKTKYLKKCQDWAFANAHELDTFKLSEKVWGVKQPNGHANGSARKTKTTALTVSDNSDSKLAEKNPDPKVPSKKKHDSKLAEKNHNLDSKLAEKNPDSKVPSNKKHDLKVAEKNHDPELADKEQDTEVAFVVKPEGDKFWDKYPCLCLFLRQGDAENASKKGDAENLSGIMMQRMPLLGSSKAKELDELEEILSEVQLTEMKLDMKKLDVRKELVKLVLDSSSKN